MFNRRKRTASNPSFNSGSKVSASAQTAAASAFVNHQASNASLSAAAAAAALKARPTTPTIVADTQTSRMIRRTNSNSSMGSSINGSTRGPPGGQLERRGSSGSMTERTFRDQSPSRGPSSPSLDDAPPVPAIPKNIPSTPASTWHRRATSMEIPATRIASPPPNQATGRGSSLEPFRGNQPPRRPAQRFSNLGNVQELTGIERPASRGSVNFSYPTGSGDISPYGQRRLTSATERIPSPKFAGQNQNLVYDPNTRSFLPESELLFYEQRIRDAADRPVKKKKKAATHGGTGKHLADGTVGGRIKGTAVHASPVSERDQNRVETSQPPPTPTEPPPVRKKKAFTTKVRPDVDFTPPASDHESDTSEKPMPVSTRGGKGLTKKPSVVREERELEEAENDASKERERQATLDKLQAGSPEPGKISPTAAPIPMGHGRGLAPASAAFAQSRQQARSVSQPPPSLSSAGTSTEPSDVESSTKETTATKGPRVQSLSPARNAHFLATPESVAIRHQPPARSISPRKSALKHSPSSRGSSPSGDLHNSVHSSHGPSRSETSETSTTMSDEKLLPKKKSVRVSFDEGNNVVLGRSETIPSDSPVIQSPQGKRTWFSNIGRGKRQESTGMDDEDDEVMKPRPALPSFGSVRERKNRDVDESPPPTKPLPEAMEPTEINQDSTSSESTIATKKEPEVPLGQSNDHAVGAVFAQEQASKNLANISRPLEPLPPEVTSVEGSGYISDTSSAHSLDIPQPITGESQQSVLDNSGPEVEKAPVDEVAHLEPTSTVLPIAEEELSEFPVAKTNGNGIGNGNGTIPSIALTQASPTIDETLYYTSFLGMPGDFPQDSDSGHEDNQMDIVTHHPTDPTPASLGITEPEPIAHSVGSPAIGDIAAENQLLRPSVVDETEESDSNSIYSDAAEDLSDMEGDGFMSLDAVVESPVVATLPSLGLPVSQESPTTRNAKGKEVARNGPSEEPKEPEVDEGWDKAQQYWSGLTADKKMELENAARQEATAESSEEEEKPAPKPQKAKKVVQRSSPQSTRADKPPIEMRNNRMYQIAPGSRAGPDSPVPVMRSSMRSPPPQADDSLHLRKSMRGSGTMRSSMRGPPETAAQAREVKGALQKKYRPMTVTQPDIRPDARQVAPVKSNKSLSAAAASAAPSAQSREAAKPAPTLRRKGSADSESSFKRARPATEGYSMKRSMRGPQQQRQTQGSPQSPEPPASAPRSSRFSLRSLSPSGSSFRGTPATGLGYTMRNRRMSSNDTPTLRSPPPENKSPLRFPGFGRSKPPPKAKPVRTRASRFADSSDEDDDVRPSFRSRFDNSSDEEDVAVRTPYTATATTTLRGIPKRRGASDDESSDLPDTDDEKPSQPKKFATIIAPPARTATPNHITKGLASNSLRRSGSGRDFMGATTTTSITAAAATANTPTKKQRGTFMSILRRKKPDPASKVRKIDAESAARRDTPLERSRLDLMAVRRQDSDFSAVSGGAVDAAVVPNSDINSHGKNTLKLQKRGTPKRNNTASSENWPLTAVVMSPHPNTGTGANGVVAAAVGEEKEEERPHTADGLDDGPQQLENGNDIMLNGHRPEIGTRRATATGLAGVDLSQVVPLKKKKKFGMLRRALRLDN